MPTAAPAAQSRRSWLRSQGGATRKFHACCHGGYRFGGGDHGAAQRVGGLVPGPVDVGADAFESSDRREALLASGGGGEQVQRGRVDAERTSNQRPPPTVDLPRTGHGLGPRPARRTGALPHTDRMRSRPCRRLRPPR